MDTLNSFLAVMHSRGLHLPYVYDIGACSGRWASSMKEGPLWRSDFWLFEANSAYKSELEKTGFRFYIETLSNPGRDYATFFKKTNTGDSYYKETTKHFDDAVADIHKCITLDKMIEENDIPVANFVKMDTQGSELDILAGASKVVGKAAFFYVECPIIKYNAGAPSFTDYTDFFLDNNYVPVNLFEIHRGEDILTQVDILFMRRDVKEAFLSKTEMIRI